MYAFSFEGDDRYVLTVIDQRTKFLFSRVSCNREAETVVDLLDGIMDEHSVTPKFLKSDNAKEFKSKYVADWLESKGIKAIEIPTYSPNQNGGCERANGTHKSILRQLIKRNPNLPWKKLVPKATSDYNKKPHSSTGYSPNDGWRRK